MFFIKKQSGIYSRLWWFSAITLCFVVASGLFWWNDFSAYRGSASVLVKEFTCPTGEAVDTIVGLTKNLSFYETLLRDHPKLVDMFSKQSPDDRRAMWNDRLRISHQSGGVIDITVWGATPEEATTWTRSTVETFVTTASRYYDMKTDIDIRLTDGPIVHSELRYPLVWATVSVVSGGVLMILFLTLLRWFPSIYGGIVFIGRLTKDVPERTKGFFTERWSPGKWTIDPRKFVPQKPERLFSFEGEPVNTPEPLPVPENSPTILAEAEAMATVTPSKVVHPVANVVAKAAPTLQTLSADEWTGVIDYRTQSIPAPDTISPSPPTILEPLQGVVKSVTMEATVTSDATTEAVADTAKQSAEPTEEEYKRRLNDLLSGKNI